MEQQMINQLITLICKSGGRYLIKDLVRETDQDGDNRNWTVEEMENATNYLYWINKNFSTADAMNIVNNLSSEYKINLSTLEK
jgi:hypothetical protein